MTNAVISLILGSVSSRLLPARMAKAAAQLLNQSCTMKRMMEVITEAVRDPKHPFRKLDHQPKKPLKNRYERRKVKEYLHLGDWQEEMV
jgi:hypothetical protein